MACLAFNLFSEIAINITKTHSNQLFKTDWHHLFNPLWHWTISRIDNLLIFHEKLALDVDNLHFIVKCLWFFYAKLGIIEAILAGINVNSYQGCESQ